MNSADASAQPADGRDEGDLDESSLDESSLDESSPSGADSARIGLVWAEAEGGVIGNQGGLPWHLPEDLAHFKKVTLGSPVVMGRRTWESLQPRFRPLPGRRNIVVTRQEDWRADGGETAHSVDEAIALAAEQISRDEFVWIIGGAQLFEGSLGVADRLEVTEIRDRFDGDTLAPEITADWKMVDGHGASDDDWQLSSTGSHYRFRRYERVR